MTDFEREDMELTAVMGGKFVDLTKGTAGKPVDVPAAKPVSKNQINPGKKCTKEEKPVESPWEPVKPAPDFMEKLKQTAKDVSLYAVLSMILFYWQQTGKLEETTAWYALLVCVGMVFFSVGKNWRGGVK